MAVISTGASASRILGGEISVESGPSRNFTSRVTKQTSCVTKQTGCGVNQSGSDGNDGGEMTHKSRRIAKEVRLQRNDAGCDV
jgi:hypothetical protein